MLLGARLVGAGRSDAAGSNLSGSGIRLPSSSTAQQDTILQAVRRPAPTFSKYPAELRWVTLVFEQTCFSREYLSFAIVSFYPS